MIFIDILKLLFFKKEKPQIISYIELNNIIPYIRNQAGKIYLINPDLKVLDNEYALLTKTQIEEFLKSDWTNFRNYRKEKFDCDDFAIVLLGRFHEKFGNCSVGFACSDTHAFNFFVDEKRKLWLIEPQTDKIFISSNSKYKINFALI